MRPFRSRASFQSGGMESKDVSDGVLWYQLGLRSPESMVLYEPWTRIQVE